jgi:hypothetical protein
VDRRQEFVIVLRNTQAIDRRDRAQEAMTNAAVSQTAD